MGTLSALAGAKRSEQNRFKAIISDIHKLFTKKRESHFEGRTKSYESLEEDGEELQGEHTPLPTNVLKELDFFKKSIATYVDMEYQTSKTNMGAKADLVMDDGTILVEDVPSTFLLFLTKLIPMLRKEVYTSVPTLSPTEDWEKDIEQGDGVHKILKPKITERTKKIRMHKITAPATEQHPAQIDIWNDDKIVGKWKTMIRSGRVETGKLAELLDYLSALEAAIIKALHEANKVTHSTDKVADGIFDSIHNFLR